MATGVRKRFLGLCIPSMLFAAMDYSLTLFGQSTEYWSGQFSHVNKALPFMSFLLRIHPVAYVAGCFMILFCLATFILLLSDTLALIVCMAASLSNTIGVSTWLLRYPHGLQLCSGFILISALVLALCLRWGWRPARIESINWELR